jgi:DNA-binding winged helix-turn-helix (wHTH) protein/tetratricopeptide (TPR) repeat protein
MSSLQDLLRFGPFLLDPHRRTLLRDGVQIAVTPKALDLLAFLIERRGTVVDREAIMQRLWPDTAVEEGNITVTVSMLRRALGESKSDHRFIVTIPGRGYEFVADVDVIGSEPITEAPPETDAPALQLGEIPAGLGFGRAAGLIAAAACVLVAVLAALPYVSMSGYGAAPDGTANLEARSLYVQGRFFLNKRTEDGVHRALEYFEQAIHRDPKFAAAHAGVADAHNMMGYFGFVPAKEAFPKAEIAARESLRLDPGLAAAHTSMAYINHRFHWNWETAEAGFKRAIALDPQYSTARHWYSAFLESMGRDDEAVAEGRKAQALDPLALVIGANLGSMLGAASRVDEAVAQCRQLLEMDRSFWPAHWTLAHAYGIAGRLGDADRGFASALELSGRSPYVLAHLAEYYAQSNRKPEAAAILVELDALRSRQYVPVYYRAMIEAALGRTDDAFRSLDQALAERSASLAFLKIRRRLESLRSDPRFQGLVRSVGLPE